MLPSLNKLIESWYASLPGLPPSPTAVSASAHALSELDLLLSTAGHTAGEHVRKLESSGAFNCAEIKLANVQNETSQMAFVVESNSTPSDVRQLSREGIKYNWKDGKADEAVTSSWPCHDPIFITPSWFSAPPGLALPIRSRPDYWRNELLYRAGDIE